MNYFSKLILLFVIFITCFSCSSTKQLQIRFTEPSPVDLSNHIKKIGVINSSTSLGDKSYTNGVEQLIVLEERWLAEKGTEAALTGLFDELAEDNRFDTVKVLGKIADRAVDFGASPDQHTWRTIASICQENGVDALFSLASHETETTFSLKKTKLKQLGMLREGKEVSGQEITLQTLMENGWRIYDPNQRVVLDEFITNKEFKATAKGVNPIAALQAIDNRRENLLVQSKQSGSAYGNRIQPRELAVLRDYFTTGSEILKLADEKVENGAFLAASQLWEQEISNPKTKISSRACHNLAVLSEFKGDVPRALEWALKSYDLNRSKDTEWYIRALKNRLAQKTIEHGKLATNQFSE